MTDEYEGGAYCVKCHLNQAMVDDAAVWAEYQDFYTGYQAVAVDADAGVDFFDNVVDYNLLQAHIGQNTGNQNNSPFYVHMATGLGTALFQFDENGCPNNPLDNDANRFFCDGTAPAENFANNGAAASVYDLDRMVETQSGVANTSSTHPIVYDSTGETNRVGANFPELAGPLGRGFLQFLADPNQGLILDSWIDADGNAQGDAANYINQ